MRPGTFNNLKALYGIAMLVITILSGIGWHFLFPDKEKAEIEILIKKMELYEQAKAIKEERIMEFKENLINLGYSMKILENVNIYDHHSIQEQYGKQKFNLIELKNKIFQIEDEIKDIKPKDLKGRGLKEIIACQNRVDQVTRKIEQLDLKFNHSEQSLEIFAQELEICIANETEILDKKIINVIETLNKFRASNHRNNNNNKIDTSFERVKRKAKTLGKLANILYSSNNSLLKKMKILENYIGGKNNSFSELISALRDIKYMNDFKELKAEVFNPKQDKSNLPAHSGINNSKQKKSKLLAGARLNEITTVKENIL